MDCINTATISSTINSETYEVYGAYVIASNMVDENKVIVTINILNTFDWVTHSRYRASGAGAPNVKVDISWETTQTTDARCDFTAQVGTESVVVNMQELPAPVFDPPSRTVTVGFYAGATIQDLLTDLKMPFDGQSPTVIEAALDTPEVVSLRNK